MEQHLLRPVNPATAGARLQPRPFLRQAADRQARRWTWVVIVPSGYNNVNASPTAGDGIGYLYVLNAATG